MFPPASREYAVLINSLIEPRDSGEFEVHILCNSLEGEVLLERARRFYRIGVPYIEDALTGAQIAIIQTKLRIEFGELLKENYRDTIKKNVMEQVGNRLREKYFVDCRCEEIRVVIYSVSSLDNICSASFDCDCGRKRKPLENLPLTV